MSSPMPGWYPDPEDQSRQRFWDGQQWTDARAFPASEVGATQPDPSGQSSGSGAWPWVVGLIVIGAFLLGLAYVVSRPGEADQTPTPAPTAPAPAPTAPAPAPTAPAPEPTKPTAVPTTPTAAPTKPTTAPKTPTP